MFFNCMLLLYGHPIRTCRSPSITILSKDWLSDIRTREILIKNFIHNKGDTVKDISSIDPFMIKGGGGGDSKRVAFVSVPRNHRLFVVFILRICSVNLLSN